MTTSCNPVQEALSWNRELDRVAQRHLLQCDACRAFLEQVTALDAIMTESTDVDVPADFADRVMSRLPGDRARKVPERRPSMFFERTPFRVALIQLGLAVGVTNVFRFVLSLVVANTAWGGPR